MNTEDIEIQHGLPDQPIRRAAEIYYEAFCRKLNPLLGTREHSLALLELTFGSS